MLKYHAAALGLKSFSCCKPARSLYRALGNWAGGRRRVIDKMPSHYFERAERNVTWCKKYAPLQPNDLVVELGTGWVHWEALTLRLFFDFQAVLYDVWDNRQLSALKRFVLQLEERFGQKGFLEGCEFDRASALIRRIQSVDTFDQLYEILGFRYVLDPSGLMESLPRESFRLVISAGVLEHIPARTAPQFIANMASLLQKGGLGINGINLADHLAFYDSTASSKQYLTFSESQWKLWCENEVQYFNRIQRSTWLQVFTQAGFQLLEEKESRDDLSSLKVHPEYEKLSREDIESTTLVLVARKS